MRRFFSLLMLLAATGAIAQKPVKEKENRTEKPEFKVQIFNKNDSVSFNYQKEGTAKINGVPVSGKISTNSKTGLKDLRTAATIDSAWKAELLNSDLYENMRRQVLEQDYSEVVYKDLPTDTLKSRLAKLNARTPFNVAYHPDLENVIKSYLKRNKEGMERLMALSEYYFPLFEQQLDRYDVPLEIKYLAIVESALNPRAKSHMGATGLWQFMFTTGKMHGLEVSSYVDERMDPVLATEAAVKYLASLYRTFGDWDLALASYNSGPGNVSKAIRRSGGSTSYWDLRKYLPRETAGYVPAFLATLYLFEYAKEHNFQPRHPKVRFIETDTVHVKQLITFDQVTKATGVDKEMLQFLNPHYKLDIVPFIEDRNYALRLPKAKAGIFVNNEDTIYNFVKTDLAEKEKGLPVYVETEEKVRYKVKKGDFLGKIAEKYGVGVSSIKRWNNLRSNNLRIGQYLTIYPRKPVAITQSGSGTGVDKSELKSYTVKKGDSLWSISQKFPGITVQNLKSWNAITDTKLKPGMVLKLSRG